MMMHRFALLLLLIILLPPLALVAQSEDDDVGGRPVSGDCENGYGVMEWRNGARYTGQFRSGRPHGTGEYRYADGSRYTGAFRNGRRDGTGTYTWPSGARYTGAFKNGQRHDGEMRYSDGRRFKGEFRENQPAKGRMRFTDGREYEGQYRDGLPHGRGELTKPDRTVEKGEFRDGQPYGKMDSSYVYDTLEIMIGYGFQPHPTVVSDASGITQFNGGSSVFDESYFNLGLRLLSLNAHWVLTLRLGVANLVGALADDAAVSRFSGKWEVSADLGFRIPLSAEFSTTLQAGGFYSELYEGLFFTFGAELDYRFISWFGAYFDARLVLSSNDTINEINGITWVEGRISVGIFFGVL